ncbi:MAG: hypothetical protein KDD35_04615 [Bdellovibrionales bacterium]|nr:hypothetical protein [Bdellovibrionales bacterium]
MSRVVSFVLILPLLFSCPYVSASESNNCRISISSESETGSFDRESEKADLEILKNLEVVEAHEVAPGEFNLPPNLRKSISTDFLRNYVVSLPEGLALGLADLLLALHPKRFEMKPRLFLANRKLARRGRLWRNHFGFLAHSYITIDTAMNGFERPAVFCVNAACLVLILVSTKALTNRYRLFQLFGYIKK